MSKVTGHPEAVCGVCDRSHIVLGSAVGDLAEGTFARHLTAPPFPRPFGWEPEVCAGSGRTPLESRA